MAAQIKFPQIKPNAKQQLFFKAKTKYIAYGGARGGGKSWAMRVKAVLLALRHKNLRVLLLRRTFAELEANHIAPLQLLLGTEVPYIVSKKVFLFPNGSILKLGYCKNEADALQYQGHEYDVILFEEATLFTEYQLTFISTCARNTRTDFTPRIYYTCNPGGVGHSYIKRLFIDKEYEGAENPDEYTFIPASVLDNTVLMEADPSYIKVLDNLPEELRKAHRDGDWDALSGQFFREFRRSTHVIEAFDIPVDWDRYITVDYGLDMLCVYWIAVDFDGQCYVYRELHEKGLMVSQAAEKILHLTGNERIKYTYLPPDLKSRSKDSGRSALQIFQEHGILGVLTENSRKSGWLCMKEMLKVITRVVAKTNRNKVVHVETTRPRLIFFDTCKVAIKHLPIIQSGDKDPNDIANEPHILTHCADALRYFVSSWISSPEVAEMGITGTYFYPELKMKGYTDAQIKTLEKRQQIKIIS